MRDNNRFKNKNLNCLYNYKERQREIKFPMIGNSTLTPSRRPGDFHRRSSGSSMPWNLGVPRRYQAVTRPNLIRPKIFTYWAKRSNSRCLLFPPWHWCASESGRRVRAERNGAGRGKAIGVGRGHRGRVAFNHVIAGAMVGKTTGTDGAVTLVKSWGAVTHVGTGGAITQVRCAVPYAGDDW